MPRAEPPRRLLDFRSGGWVLLLAALMLVAAATVVLLPVLGGQGRLSVGDGANVESYGFNLSGIAAQRDYLVAAGFPKDGLPAWTDPVLADADQVAPINQALREAHVGKALTTTDLVIGVSIGGAARAYPLRFLTLHEFVNDDLAQTPLLVTYNPLCASSAVYDRRVDGATLEFGISGLLLHSNPLLYDRQGQSYEETLWSQLTGRGLSGGARVGVELKRVPHQVVPWSAWLTRHPDSQVMLPARGRYKLYKRVSYNMYRSLGRPQFPAAALPTNVDLAPFDLILAVRAGEAWEVFPMRDVVARGTPWQTPVGAAEAAFTPLTPESAWVATSADVVRCAWFAWAAFHPDSRVVDAASGFPRARE